MSENQNHRRPASVSISDSEVQRTLDFVVDGRLRKIIPALVLVYLTLSVTSFSARETIPAWFAFSSGIIFLISWMMVRRRKIPLNQINAFASGIGILILAQSLVKFYLNADVIQVAATMLLLMGAANTLLSWRSYAVLGGLSVVGWICVGAPHLADSQELVLWLLGLVSTTALCGYGIHLRFQQYWRAEDFRLKASLEAELQNLEEQNKRERFERAVEGTEDGFWYWDLQSNLFHGSPSWETMLGCEMGELGTDPDEWMSRVHPGYLAKLQAELAAHLHGESPQFRNEHRLRRKDGTYIWVLARGKAVRNSAGEPLGLAGSHADITSMIEVENRILNDSCHDKLTDLPNRNFLMGRLDALMERKRRFSHRAPLFAVMFLDLDRFKVVNDSLGHLAGDQLLEAVAGRLRNCARPDDVVARFGGDEFVILLERIRDPEEALAVGERVHKALAKPFRIAGREVATGASIGIALSQEGIHKSDDLLRHADIAMYHAKTHRKGQVQLFSENMDVQAANLCELQNDLGRALDRKELRLHYQPCVATHSGEILGVEALIRWQRTETELLQPADFIPLAEEMGLIGDIGEWALRSACQQNRAWQQAGIAPVKMAVNLSARQLQEKDFPQRVLRILEETNLPSQWLELELTETALMDNLDLAPSTLERLGAMGIRTSIDDFGTGYSSLNYLRRFDFHSLKMDRSFVTDVATDPKAAAVARSVISLAHNLGLSVIAEGVERNDQLAFLAAEGCDQIQGFLASRPITSAAFTDLLQGADFKQQFMFAKLIGGREEQEFAERLAASGVIQ